MSQRIATTACLCTLLLSPKQVYGSQDDSGFSPEWIEKLVQSARQNPGPDDKFIPVSDEEIAVALRLSSKNSDFGWFKKIYGGDARDVYERGVLKQKIGIDYRSIEESLVQAGLEAEEINLNGLQITLPVAYPPQFYALKKLSRLTFQISPGGDLNRPVEGMDLCSFRLIAELPSLRGLGVSCPSNGFPMGFGFCKQLIELKVSTAVYEVFVDLPDDLFDLKNLQKLDLSTCQIKAIPDGIGRLRDLVELNISGNVISEISDQIGKLVNLRTLNTTINRLSSLPDSFTQLSALESLNMAWCIPCDRLPFQIRKGVFPNLKVLSIWKNSTKQLPDNFAELSSLEELYAGDNPLESLPENLHQMSQLRTLDLASEMTNEPPSPSCLPAIWKVTSLRSLRLEGCAFGLLPQDIGGLVHLTHLNLRNAFTMVEFAPILYTLPNITELNVAATGLTAFPEGLSAFKRLEKLTIGSNPFDQLCKTAPILPCLKDLDVSYTNLCKLPDWISHFKRLVSLSAYSCALTEIPGSIGELTGLKDIIICDQKGGLKMLPGSIINLTELQFLNIEKDGVETLPYALKLLVDSGQLNIAGFTGQFVPPPAARWWSWW